MNGPFEFGKMITLLGLSLNSSEVRSFFGPLINAIERDEYYGSLQFKSEGVDVAFKEAAWVSSATEPNGPSELYVTAFHLYSAGHEGFAEYQGHLPNETSFGDSELEVLRKMGTPLKSGGGVPSRVTSGMVPKWHQFAMRNAILHFQFNARNRVELVTLSIPN
jgi:hypothetical protein